MVTRLTPELDEIAKDFLIKGLRDRDLRKDVIKNSKWSFDEAIEYVRDMAATDEVLDLKKSSTDVEVNIMQVKKESPQAKHRTDRNWTDKRCYFCGILGHIKRDCRRRREPILPIQHLTDQMQDFLQGDLKTMLKDLFLSIQTTGTRCRTFQRTT